MTPPALESHPGLTVTERRVRAREGHQLRAVTVHPEGAPLATVLFIAGFSPDPVHLPGRESLFTPRLMADLARAGFAALRVEKRGVGGSEGAHCRDIGFDAEQSDLRAAVRSVEGPLLIFGHSLGAMHAPMVVDAARDLRGMVLWGAGLRTWTEYCDALTRRTVSLMGDDEPHAESVVRAQQRFFARVLFDGWSLDEVMERERDVKGYLGWLGVSGGYVHRRTLEYWRGVYEARLAEPLVRCGAPVLAAWGESDWLSFRDEHEGIARVVNDARPGEGSFIAVPGVDHFLHARPTMQSSFDGEGRGEYTRAAVEALLPWMRARVGA